MENNQLTGVYDHPITMLMLVREPLTISQPSAFAIETQEQYISRVHFIQVPPMLSTALMLCNAAYFRLSEVKKEPESYPFSSYCSVSFDIE